MLKNKQAFTLIELLVVVLIIGILAAVALPQYQKAVKKARVARIIPLVRALVVAEKAYYLAQGNYTANLLALDIEMPKNEGCRIDSGEGSMRYECDDYVIGIYNGITNAQGGLKDIRYLEFFDDYDDAYTAPKGTRICMARGEISKKVCQALGPGQEMTEYAGVWDFAYRLD